MANYLKQKKLRPRTIKLEIENLNRFIKWAAVANINYQRATYNEILTYIQSLQDRNLSKGTINKQLNSIDKYYEYLLQSKITNTKTIIPRVKDSGKKVIQHLLSSEQLEHIYQSYEAKAVWEFKNKPSKNLHQRNIILLGLMIYQGLETEDIKKLEINHINLKQGSIYIPSRSRNNSRTLKLNAVQILPLQAYMQTCQDKVINGNIGWIIDNLLSELKKSHPEIKTVYQIKPSVIVNWLKQYNIRQVQYMAGHKYISSTERYKEEDLRDLQAQLNLFHPMK